MFGATPPVEATVIVSSLALKVTSVFVCQSLVVTVIPVAVQPAVKLKSASKAEASTVSVLAERVPKVSD
jgi:hypothetical protein